MNPFPIEISRARHMLYREYPYLSDAIYGCQIKIIKNLMAMSRGPACVSKNWIIYIDEDEYKKWSCEETAGIIWHEVNHVLRRHYTRLQYVISTDLANIAADLELHDDQPRLFPLPKIYQYVNHELFDVPPHLVAEEYVDLIKKKTKCAICNKLIFGGENNKCTCFSNEGSGVHGRDAPWEGGHAADGIKESHAEIIRQRVARKILERRTYGSIPLGLLRWAKEVQNAKKINWRRICRGLIKRTIESLRGYEWHTYARLSRRPQVSQDILSPAWIRNNPCITVILDLSGSVSDKEHGVYCEQLGSILQEYREIFVVAADAAIHFAKKIRSKKQVLALPGRGGTDMGRAIREVNDKYKRMTDIIIVMTDGKTPWPEQPPPIPVIVALVRDPKIPTPSWAKVINLYD